MNHVTSQYEINLKFSCFEHNHCVDDNIQSKQLNEEERKFIHDKIKQKKLTPAELKEKLEDKYGKDYDYRKVANEQRIIGNLYFGDPTEDAALLQSRLIMLKKKFPDMLATIKKNNKNEFEGLIFAMPSMKNLATHFFDLVILDTTFSTNRFRMKHLSLCGRDNHNKTILFVEGLISQETIEQFRWFFIEVKKYFNKQPQVILMDADPALLAAVEQVFPQSISRICGWHTECNIKKHLFGMKKSKFDGVFLFKFIRT